MQTTSTNRVPYLHHNPYRKSLRDSVTELARAGYNLAAIAAELGLTASGRRRAANWLEEEAKSEGDRK